MRHIKIALGAAVLIGLGSVFAWGLAYNSRRSWPAYLCNLRFPQGVYTLDTPGARPGQMKDPNEKLSAKVTVAHAVHYIVGTTVHVSQDSDGSILVPYVADQILYPNPGWGGRVNGVRIEVSIDRPVVKSGEPLYAQVTIENHGETPFYIRTGCGANLNLALPEIDDINGHPVRELFRIGQDTCWATSDFSIPVKTTAYYVFNVRDLYVIDRPGQYTMSMDFPVKFRGIADLIALHHSGRIAFEVR